MKKDHKPVLITIISVVLIYLLLECSGVLKNLKSGYAKSAKKEM